MAPNKKIQTEEQRALKTKRVWLNKRQRRVVDLAIREVCAHRGYALYALNVRTNHAHVVVAATATPEHVMDTFKSYATRHLRKGKLLDQQTKPWARHGSTRYLWTDKQLLDAIEYVMFGQGDERFYGFSIAIVALPHGRASDTTAHPNFFVDAWPLLFYYPRNTGKEVIQKYMSNNHSEVAET